jgi:hypothetical protein
MERVPGFEKQKGLCEGKNQGIEHRYMLHSRM